MTGRALPLQHLSVRVPWHDNRWTGTVCHDPLSNGACLRLTRISEQRDDAFEVAHAGVSWDSLPPGTLPPCSAERAGFMQQTSRRVTKSHPYAEWYDSYRRFVPTSYDVPGYSAECVPFRWMLRKEAVQIAEALQLDYDHHLEEEVDRVAGLHDTAWVQHAQNQQLMLDTFFSAVQSERSLVFFYAKESPLSADPRRLLVGVGRAVAVGSVIPYVQQGDGFGSVLWERVLRHSVRPAMEDGFLLPYHDVLALAAVSGADPAEHAVFVPDGFGHQFSYASEHVSHDAAVELLLSLDRALERVAGVVDGSWSGVRAWLSDRLGEVWEARGPNPGLGAALTAFGIPEGVLLAHAVHHAVGDGDDPWPLVDSWLRDPSVHPEPGQRVSTTMSKAWAALSEERRALLQLLSRFHLSTDQAIRFYQPSERDKAGIAVTDAALLANPFAVFELDRFSPDPVSVGVVDRGVFPEDRVRAAHPLPAPSAVDDPVDPRRVRAHVIDVLEDASAEGDSLRAASRVVQQIRDRPLQPPCPVSVDIMSVCEPQLPPEVRAASMADGAAAYQLDRLSAARTSIGKTVHRRRAGRPHAVTADWRAVIDDELGGPASADDVDEQLARKEKAAALEVLATTRICVLVGAAGTGKTTLLRALSKLPEVAAGGLLLLAPTGKARVRLQESIGSEAGARALTIAQLLLRVRRYDGATGRYHRSDADRMSGARTVVVDESSMLTEEALDALLDGLEQYDRLILVGDPRQLPPIGVGRPFVDIVEFLREECGALGFPRVGPSYAELTVPRRQVVTGEEERDDLTLAEWFAGGEASPGADEVWDRLGRDGELPTVRARRWDMTTELHDLIRAELSDALDGMSGPEDAAGFQVSYGGTRSGDHVYFNLGAANKVEDWQVLSPVRASGGGVNELNRLLQRAYREATLRLARNPDGRARKVPKPAGPQEVVYGDKVINVRNATRKHYYPALDDALAYVANGEIGVVTGPFRGRNRQVPLKQLEVEFSTQPGTAYKFWMSELGGDDGTPVLELAYAITIHKAQGSEFGRTFVIVPNPCRLLSRELLYTALTRQRGHITILHQGELSGLREYASAAHSETARRLTNLFVDPSPVQVGGGFLEAGLIHMTRRGISVRSKSEVIIADLLYAKDVPFVYEAPLIGADGSWRAPDFTIEDDESGMTFYWEHLGMLQRPAYARKWAEKLAWYRAHGVLPREEGGGSRGTLITTQDGPDGSISSKEIEDLVDEVLS